MSKSGSSSSLPFSSVDLNFRLICKDCKVNPPNIIEDFKSGDLICGICGLIYPMRIIDPTSEWRNFSTETTSGGTDMTRVGAAENPLLEGVGDHLSTSISGKDNYSGASQLLSKTQSRVSGSVKGGRDLMVSFREISAMCERIGLPKMVGDKAKQLYKKVFDEDIGKGKSNLGMMAACLFLAVKNLLII
jgi:transcription initiation factor TFIIB